MLQAKSRKQLVAVITLLTACLSSAAIFASRQNYWAQEREHLRDVAVYHASSIEGIANFETAQSPNEAADVLRSQIIAHALSGMSAFSKLNETGEVLLAQKNGESVQFLNELRFVVSNTFPTYPWNSLTDEATKLALQKQSGVIAALDYRGTEVLAAYQWIPEIDVGIVVKVDMAELSSPINRATAFSVFAAIAATILLIVFADKMFLRLARKLAGREEQIDLLLESTGEAIYGVDKNGICTFVNPACVSILGYKNADQVIGRDMHELLHVNENEKNQTNNTICKVCESHLNGVVTRSNEKSFFRSDKSSFQVDYRAYPLLRDGTLLGSVVTFSDISENKRTEKALQHSQAILAEAQSIAHIGSWEWDIRKNCLLWTDEMFQILGLNARDVHPSFEEFMAQVHDLDKARVQQSVKHVLNHADDEFDVEHRIMRPDGSVRMVHGKARVYFDEEGFPERMIGTMQDSTQMWLLQEERDRFVNLSVDLLCVVTMDALFVQASPAWEKRLGYPEQALIGRSLFDFVHPDDQISALAFAGYLAKGQEVRDFVVRFQHRDGRDCWLNWNATTSKMDGLVYAIAHDITAKKEIEQQVLEINNKLEERVRERTLALTVEIGLRNEIEEALRDSENQYRDLYENAPVGYCTVECESGDIVQKNVMFTRLFAYDEDSIGSMHLPDLFAATKNGADKIAAILEKIQHGYEQVEEEVEMMNRRGENLLVQVSVTPVASHLGKITQSRIVFRDITVEKQAEKERFKLEQRLQQSQKMEAIGQLTGGIAHDFNNILASILGYGALAKERFATDETSKLHGYLTEILRAGERAKNLVQQMLAFGRSATSVPKSQKLSPLINETLDMLHSTIPSTVEITKNLSQNVPDVMVDSVQIYQMVMNLCINARDAMNGVGRLLIETDWWLGEPCSCTSCGKMVTNDFIRLSVKDSGSGIPESVLAKIFDPFFSTKEVGKGSGMGLSMVHGIMHEYDGHIVVETKENEGTTFHLLFPIQRNKEVGANGVDMSAKTDDSIRLLIVDDEPSVAGFLRELFESRGYSVHVETNSRNALNNFKQAEQQYDLVITDQTMPGMTGEEMAKAMLQEKPGLPIILCTGYSDQIDESRALKLGIRKFLVKPIDPLKLVAIADEVCAG